VLILLWLAGLKLRRILLFLLPVLLIAVVMVFWFHYHRARIDSYSSSLLDPLDGAHQVRQSSLALAGGGVLGRGLGEGGQKRFFLPEAHTDFIFASSGEEIGFLPLSGLLFFYLFLGWKSYQIAYRSRDDNGFFLAIGVGTLLVVNALLNLGVVLALLPVTGVPLPFVSYGGSSLFMNLVGIGLLLSVMRQSYVSSRSKLLNGGLIALGRGSHRG
jgi:cell division protein FtsW